MDVIASRRRALGRLGVFEVGERRPTIRDRRAVDGDGDADEVQSSRGGGPIEAPAIVRRGDFYYLFVSFDFCCRGLESSYKIMVGRAEQITGPYVDRDGKPMMEGGGTLLLDSRGRYHGPGGQAVVLDDGVYRLVHHYYDHEERGAPKLQIHDLSWTADGWPEVSER